MKYAYIVDNVVCEIVPEFDEIFGGIPLQQRYSKEFLSKCVQCGDEVTTGMIYEGGEFKPAPIPEPDPEDPDVPVPEAVPTVSSKLAELESQNRLLTAQLKATSESNAMLEDCLVEMAGVVYA